MTKSPTPMAITPLSKASIAGGRYTSPLSNIDAIKYKQLKITTIIPNMCKKRPTNKYHPTFHYELKLSEDGLGSNIKLNAWLLNTLHSKYYFNFNIIHSVD